MQRQNVGAYRVHYTGIDAPVDPRPSHRVRKLPRVPCALYDRQTEKANGPGTTPHTKRSGRRS